MATIGTQQATIQSQDFQPPFFLPPGSLCMADTGS